MRIAYLLLACLLPLPARAADETYHVEVPLAKAKKKSDRAVEPLDRVALHLWVPDGVKVLRGVAFNPFNDKQVEQKHWQEACRLWGFGIVGANYFGVDAKEFADTFQKGLARLAADQKRPELAHVPACLIGMSAGAGMCVKFAEQMPDRVIAVAAVCLEVGPTGRSVNDIPFLTIFGEKDGKQMEILTEKLPKAREFGAEWAIAVQWGRRHEFGAANNLVMPFFDSAIRIRYPDNGDPARGPVKLAGAIDFEDTAWTAEIDSWNEPAPHISPLLGYVRQDTGVLPDRYTAQVWRAFVVKEPKLVIREPAALGDGKPFSPLPAEKPVKVVVSGTKAAKKVILFDGNRELVTAQPNGADEVRIEVKDLKPGIHSLIAGGVAGKGFLGYSRPTTVIVSK
jgi:hypothetical protein